MHPQLPILIDLQTVDLRILEIKDQERKLPALLQASETPLQEAREQSQMLAKELDMLNKDRRDRERDLDVHEAHVGKLRTRLMELKTATPTITAPSTPRELPNPPIGSIAFENVSFRYPSRPESTALA